MTYRCWRVALGIAFVLAFRASGANHAVIAAVVETQEASHRGEAARAEGRARTMMRRWPHEATGYYVYAALLHIRTFGCVGVGSPDETIAYLDSAVALGKSHLRHEAEDVWTHYIVGLALGLKAVLAVQNGSLWEAYRTSNRGMDALETALRLDPSFADAWLPVGAYHFWRGESLKRWSWLPFITDTRARGIAELRRAARLGRTTQVSAQSMIAWALLTVERFDEALSIADSMCVHYPRNRSFLWVRAEALKALGRWREAEDAFDALLDTFGSDEAECTGPVEIRAKIGMMMVEQGECNGAVQLLRAAVAFRPPPRAENDFAPIRKEAERYLRRCTDAERRGR